MTTSKLQYRLSQISLLVLLFCLAVAATAAAATTASVHAAAAFREGGGVAGGLGPVVRRDKRSTIVSNEYGEITAARVSDRINGSYHLQFITLEPNALLLPVLLHADMVFYVHTGTGRLGWTEGDEDEDKVETKHISVRRGDVYRLRYGSVFFVQSSLEPERQKLRIHAIFAVSNNDLREPPAEPYSSISDMVLGFDNKVLQAAFQVPADVIESITSAAKPAAIVHGEARKEGTTWEEEIRVVEDLVGLRGYGIFDVNNKKGKKKKTNLYNIFDEDPDFENCNGWSLTVTGKKLAGLEGSNIGFFVVNLTKGSMMGPHWNPMATEIAIAVEGCGMVRVVCPSMTNATECQSTRFEVREGDVFAVPRFHPMAQMAFNNGSFVFLGFTTSEKKNHPQFIAGQASVLRVLDRDIVAAAFNVANTIIDQLLAPQGDSVILDCTSCAEEELRLMEEEREREREEERRREEEEARKREEERRREEEEARKREEEEARREEEERRKREEEEARRREEEEAQRRQEEEEARRREEEAAQRRQEEEQARRREEEQEAEARRRQEEEEARRREQQQEEEARRQEEEEARRREQQREEEARQRGEEAERTEEEEARRRQEEEEARRRQEEEEARRRQEEEEAHRREEEQAREEERRRQEEAEREEEEARREEEEEAEREEEEASREEEEFQRRQQEKERGRGKQEEEGEWERGPEEAEREEEEARREEEEEAEREEEEARREEEEFQRRQQEKERGRGEQEEEGEWERGPGVLWARKTSKRLTI